MQVGELAREPFRLHLEVGGGLGDAELLRVEARDVRGVRVGAVLGDDLGVLRLHRPQLAGEPAEGILGVLDAQVARLLEGRDGLVYAGYGDLVGLDVEVVDGVVDELVGGGEREENVSWYSCFFVDGKKKNI